MIIPQHRYLAPDRGTVFGTSKGLAYEIPHNSTFDITSEITLECWVYMDRLPENMDASFPSLINKSNEAWRLGVHSQDTSKMGFRLNYLDTNEVDMDFTIGASPGEWVHFAATFDGKIAILYEDGIEQKRTELSTTASINTDSNNIKLGNNWEGKVREARIWNVARTQEQIKKFKNRSLTGREPGLVSYWPADEGSGASLYDRTNNKNHAQANGVGFRSGYLLFRSSDDTDDLDFPGWWSGAISQFTIEMDMFLDDPAPAGSYFKFLGDEKYGDTEGFYLGDYKAGESAILGLRIADGTSRGEHSLVYSYPVEEMFRLSVVFDNGQIEFYKDGNLIDSGSISVSSLKKSTLRVQTGSSPNRYLQRLMFWDSARTQSEIQATLSTPPDGTETDLRAYYLLDEGSGTRFYDSANSYDGWCADYMWRGVHWEAA